MTFTVITINRDNASGLEKTMKSVISQTRKDFEYVIVDGASTDGSLEVIQRLSDCFENPLKWISEPDGGIYNAMNKAIGMATGEYLFFLNSGDWFFSQDVVRKASEAIEKEGRPAILCGNIACVSPEGRIRMDRKLAHESFSFRLFYEQNIPHQAAMIRRELFERYGFYDETLKIVSDWKWFLKVVGLHGEKPVYAPITLAYYDQTGISSANIPLVYEERRAVLSELIPASIRADYRERDLDVRMVRRLKRYPWAYRIVWFLERCLFKWEKWTNPRDKKK